MALNSVKYLLFLALSACVHAVLPQRYRNILLLLAGVFFCASSGLHLGMTLDEFLSGEGPTPPDAPCVSARHMAEYSRYLAARARRRTAWLAAALALVLLAGTVLAVLCTDRTFFTGRYESEFLSGVTIPVPRYCLYSSTGGLEEYTVKLKTLRQPDELHVWIRSYLSTLEALPNGGDPIWGDTVWYDAAQDLTLLQYRANNDGIGFVNTIYITYRTGRTSTP